MPLAVVCPVHGAQMFAGLDIGDSYMADIRGMGPCPLCGHPSPITEGVFNFDSTGDPHVVAAPAWSVAALRDLRDQLEKLRRDVADTSVSDEEIARQVDILARPFEEDDNPFGLMLRSAVVDQPRPQARHNLKQIIVALEFYYGDGEWVDKVIARLKQVLAYLFG